MRLKDKVVFVTDADSDSGRAIACRLAKEGAALILNCRADDNEAKVFFAQLPCKSMIINIDPSSKIQTDSAVDTIIKQMGKIDVLIHNNNEVEASTVENCTEEEFDRAIRINAKSAFICTQSVGYSMKKQGFGKIIYVSSIHDEKPTGCAFTYSAAKGAVKMLAREAALDLGIYNVCVNLIEMGPMKEDDKKFKSDSSFIYEDYISKIPNRVLGTMDDLANLALFMASDECKYLNGADIRMDGGFTLHYIDRPSYEEDTGV